MLFVLFFTVSKLCVNFTPMFLSLTCVVSVSFHSKSTIVFLIRDYELETPLASVQERIANEMRLIWYSVVCALFSLKLFRCIFTLVNNPGPSYASPTNFVIFRSMTPFCLHIMPCPI